LIFWYFSIKRKVHTPISLTSQCFLIVNLDYPLFQPEVTNYDIRKLLYPQRYYTFMFLDFVYD
jgi:hypothetical protein